MEETSVALVGQLQRQLKEAKHNLKRTLMDQKPLDYICSLPANGTRIWPPLDSKELQLEQVEAKVASIPELTLFTPNKICVAHGEVVECKVYNLKIFI